MPARLKVTPLDIPTTLRDPQRVAQRREELVRIATEMFLEKGFHATSIKDIVRKATFNVASLYMYVSSKEDILDLVVNDFLNTLGSEMQAVSLSSNDPLEDLSKLYLAYVDIVYRYRRQFRLIYRELHFLEDQARRRSEAGVDDVISVFEDMIEKAVKEGLVKVASARLSAMNLVYVANMLSLHTVEITKNWTPQTYASMQLEMFLVASNARK